MPRSRPPAIVAAGLQLVAVTADPAANVSKIERLGRQMKAAHPDLGLLVVPELGVTGYSAGERFHDLAELWPAGESLQRLARLAGELDVVLVAGYAEAAAIGELIYDSAAVFERDGTPITSYRKTHCLDTERRFFANGDDLPLISTSVGRLGVMICWDAAFPEVARTHALAGADLFVTIGAWEDPYVGDWDLVAAARAYDNVVPAIAVNRVGLDGEARFSGHSCAVDCLGRSIARLGDEPDGLLVATIDYGRTDEVRAGYGSQLRDRRPELYAAVSTPAAAPVHPPSSRERM